LVALAAGILLWNAKKLRWQIRLLLVVAISAVALLVARFVEPRSPTVSSNATVAGMVVDNATGRPLAGVSISLAGRKESTWSESNGNFALKLESNSGDSVRLEASKVGYATLDQTVAPPRSDLMLSLQPESKTTQ
jgi:hypothetical protein